MKKPKTSPYELDILGQIKSLNNEQCLSDFINYSHHYDDKTITTFDNKLLRVFEIKGVSFETASDDEINKWHRQLHQMLMTNADKDLSFWVHLIKEEDNPPKHAKLKTNFSKNLHKTYNQKLVDDQFHRFSLFITVCINNNSSIPFLSKLTERFTKKEDQSLLLENANDRLDSISRYIEKIDHKPRCLSTYEQNNQLYSEPLSFLSRLISGEWQSIALNQTAANKLVGNSRINAGKETLEIRTATDTFYSAALGLKDYPNATSPMIFSRILSLPFPFILSQSFHPISKEESLTTVKKTQRILSMTGDDAVSQTDAISDLTDDIASRRVIMGNHNLSLFVFTDKSLNDLPGQDDNKKIKHQIKERLSLARKELGDLGANPVREDLAMIAQLFAMMPANCKFRPRTSLISSNNFCAMFPMHTIPNGRWDKKHWGESVMSFKTRANTLYDFSFHLGTSDLGHTLLFGSSGQGKTTLQTMLLSQSEKFDAKVVFFDRGRGSEIFIRALGGRYEVLRRGEPTGFNPYQLEPTKRNLDFLTQFTLLLAYPKGDFSPSVENEVAEVIMQTLSDPEKPKELRNFNQLYGHFQSEDIRARLHKWRRGNQNGWLIDNDNDEFNFDKQMVGIDTTDFLEDKILSPVCFYYLTYRLEELYGSRFFAVFDEFWKMLQDPVFLPWIQDGLKLMRRKGGIFFGATQDTNDITQSSIASTLLGQCPTRIFLQNFEAKKTTYEAFNISDIEFQFIKGIIPGQHEFLVKQGSDSVIASMDLGGLDDELSVLSGRESNLSIMEKCIEETSTNPNDWLPLYFKRYSKE